MLAEMGELVKIKFSFEELSKVEVELGGSGWARLRAREKGVGLRAYGGPWEQESEQGSEGEGHGEGLQPQAGGTVSPEANSLRARQCGPPLQHCREQGPGLGAEVLASWQGPRPVPYPLSQLWLHRAM